MNLTIRQRKILQILIDEEREVTLSHIADRIDVSIKTVHRELIQLSRSLERDYRLHIQARPGLGLRLLGEKKSLQQCRQDLKDTVPSDTAPEERQRILRLLLLETEEPVKLSALAEELYTSVSVVRHDLDILQSWFTLQQLQLTLRKGMGLKLDGSEAKKREALVLLLWEQFGETGLINLLRSDSDSTALCLDESDLLALRIIPLHYIRYAEHILAGLSRDLLPDLAPQDYLQLVLVLAVAAVRKRSGYSLSQLEGDLGASVDIELRRIARAAVSGIFSHFSIPEDEAELQAIARFLKGARPERLGKELLADNLQMLPEISLLIQKCSAELGQDLNSDRLLRDGLLAHWVPAVYRLRHRLPIQNPLLSRIKQEYGLLFRVINKIVQELFPDLSVPEDEIGYLVLHFGSALSRIERERRRYRALVVCSAGIGTANMLASRLRERVPDIALVFNVSWFDIQNMSLDGWDILISTIPLPLSQDSYVLVDPLLSDEGVQKIRLLLNSKGIPQQPEGRTEAVPASHQYKEEHNLTKLIEHIFVITSCRSGMGWEEFLASLIQTCAGLGFVSDQQAALNALVQRASDFGMVLPESRCLFLHARSSAILVPFFTIHRFSQPLALEPTPWPVQPTTVLLMLAPQNIEDQDLALLNEISVSLLDPEVLVRLETGTEQDIRRFYKQLLDTDQGGIHHVRHHAY